MSNKQNNWPLPIASPSECNTNNGTYLKQQVV